MNEPQTDTPKTYAEINWASEYDPDCEVVSAELSSKLEKELAAVTEQRDRLAEALRVIIIEEESRDREHAFNATVAREALAAVEGGADELQR